MPPDFERQPIDFFLQSDAMVYKMIEGLDPFHHDLITFSDAVACLLNDIRSRGAADRASTAKRSGT